ncbi:hypothetical protein HD806DRAFT_529498 [Xylariaceae sp. AK1471]|nr:hypothetical protein HD806DRAFT_529498 [Xylariaceae sp. AK1471]
MSGLEIAGLALGALPLAIKAIQGYRETFSSFKYVKRDLDFLERDLQTEQLRLQNTCETLLVGIVSPMKINAMIADPFGPEWKSYADQLDDMLIHRRRLRLWTSSDKFEGYITEMRKATQELRLQLGIEEGSQINSRDRASILEAFKQNTSFTLKRKEYGGILSRIKASNAALQDLSKVHRELEPDRRRRSQSRVTKLLRGLSRSIYNALCSAVTCACVYSHMVGLQLVYRDAVVLPTDIEEMVARSFDFQIALRTLEVTNENETMDNLHHVNVNGAQLMSRWKKFQLRLIEDSKPIPSLPRALPTSTSPSTKHGVRWASMIKFESPKRLSLSPSTTQPLIQTSIPLRKTTKNTERALSKVSNLCEVAQRKVEAKAIDRYGYVLDTERKFELSPSKDEVSPSKAITLYQVIDGCISDLPPFGFQERLQVALALSVSVLHLHGTPWLSQIVTLDDIVFLYWDTNTTNKRQCTPYQPFVTKNIPNGPASHAATSSTTLPTQSPSPVRPINLAVLSLGALLIQIILGRVENELMVTDHMDISTIVSKREIGRRLEEEILVNGGINYADAVKWCLDSVYGVSGLQNDKFCQNFYEAVVAPLEDDIKTIA